MTSAPRKIISRLDGAHAGRDLEPFETLIDLVDHLNDRGEPEHTDKVARVVGEAIPKGARLEVRSDGRIYPAPKDDADSAS